MSAKKPPSVDMPTDTLKDESYEVIAEVAGLANKYEAIGRVYAIRCFCRDRGLQDAPEDSPGYVVSEAIIQRWLGKNGVRAILGDGCDDFALGVLREDGRIMLRGTEDLVAALRQRTAVSSAGGLARRGGPRGEGGRFAAGGRLDECNDDDENPGWLPAGPTVSETTVIQPAATRAPAEEPPAQPAGGQPQPASSSYLLPPSGSQNTHTRARERHPDAGRIARLAWDLGAKLCGELKQAKVAGVPVWPLMHDGDHPGWVALLDRVGELLIAESVAEAERIAINRVNVAFAKARSDGEGAWFASTSMFTRNSFEHWARLDPKSFGTKRAGPKRAAGALIGAAKPRSDHPESPTLKPFNEL